MLKRNRADLDPMQSIIPIFDEIVVLDSRTECRVGKYYRFNSNYKEYESVVRKIVQIARSGIEIQWK